MLCLLPFLCSSLTYSSKDELIYFSGKNDVKFLAILVSEWCPHCVQSASIFKELEDTYENETRFQVVRINCDNYNTICKKFPETATPGIYWVFSTPDKAEQYQGSVTFANINSFIEKHIENTFINIDSEEVFEEQIRKHNDTSIFVYQKSDDEESDLTDQISLISQSYSNYPCTFFNLKYKQNKETNQNVLYNYNSQTKQKIMFDSEFNVENISKFINELAFPPISIISNLFFDHASANGYSVLLLADEIPYFLPEIEKIAPKIPHSLRTGVNYCGNSPRLCTNLLIRTGRGPQLLIFVPSKNYNYYYKDELKEDLILALKGCLDIITPV